MKTNTIFFFVIWLPRNMKNLYSITVSWSLRKSTIRRPEKIASICSKLLRNIYDHVTAGRLWPKKGTFIIRWNDDRWCLALTSPGFLAGEVEKWPSQGAPGRRKDRRHHTWPRIKKSRWKIKIQVKSWMAVLTPGEPLCQKEECHRHNQVETPICGRWNAGTEAKCVKMLK